MLCVEKALSCIKLCARFPYLVATKYHEVIHSPNEIPCKFLINFSFFTIHLSSPIH